MLRQVTHGKAFEPLIFSSDGASYPAVAATEKDWIAVWIAQVPDGPRSSKRSGFHAVNL